MFLHIDCGKGMFINLSFFKLPVIIMHGQKKFKFKRIWPKLLLKSARRQNIFILCFSLGITWRNRAKYKLQWPIISWQVQVVLLNCITKRRSINYNTLYIWTQWINCLHNTLPSPPTIYVTNYSTLTMKESKKC